MFIGSYLDSNDDNFALGNDASDYVCEESCWILTFGILASDIFALDI
jgi:hypothetical protein